MNKTKREAIGNDDILHGTVPAGKPPDSQQQSLAEIIHEPTATDLAIVAANLGLENERDWASLASKALDLWEACAKEVMRRHESRRNPMDQLERNLPKPESYPVPLEHFLELLLPQRRVPDRMRAYRHFLEDWKGLNLQEAGDLLAQHRQEPAHRLDYLQRAFVFQEWIKTDLSCTKRLNGLESHGKLPRMRIESEKKKAIDQRRNAVARAADQWHRTHYSSIKGLIA